MMNLWSDQEIEAILLQLHDRGLPFRKYEFAMDKGELCLLGKGATANVYRAVKRKGGDRGYAVKVIGFGDRRVDSDAFYRSVQAQRELGEFQDNIVRIYDSQELLVWIESDNRVVKAEKIPFWDTCKEEPQEGLLHLQFILMEEIAAVISGGKPGIPSLIPQRLARFEEEEILHLAYDIGTALSLTHKEHLIHRDVKLENIFYTPRGNHYKLGDFGIAKIMENGMASTVAFTNGYGAPEVVGTLEDRYDATADIYSLGMVLYVLLNGLHFPGSPNYHPNVAQYKRGFVPDRPVGGTDALCKIVLKMIQSDPDDRYQSMEEVLDEIDKLRHGTRVQFQREHKRASLTLGLLFGMIGAVQLVADGYGLDLLKYGDLRWEAGLLLSLSAVLLFYYFLLNQRDTELTRLCFEKNGYWLLAAIGYAYTAAFGLKYRSVLPIGICGMAFCAIWVCRENLLLWINRKK